FEVTSTAQIYTLSLHDALPIWGDAMKIAAGINQLLQAYVPGGVAKYDDTYSPRSFGDNFQSWGTRTVLIESGGYKGDPEKQFIRSEEHTSELQSRENLVCRLLL